MATVRPSAASRSSALSPRRLSRRLGFANGFRTALFLFVGGFMMLFSLERLNWYLNNAICSRPEFEFPGECYWWSRGFQAVAFRAHLLSAIPGGFLACLQFLPVLQRGKLISFHRVNGYLVLVLAIIGGATGGIIGTVSVGGTLLMQVGGWITAGSFGVALVMAYISIRRLQIDQHREWMLRAWSYAGMIVTMRPMLFALAAIISGPNSPYYQPIACKEIDFMLHGSHEAMTSGPHDSMMKFAPGCAAYMIGENPAQYTAVQANWTDENVVETAAAFQVAFTVSGYLAFVIHAFAVEIYINCTRQESERLRIVSKQRRMQREQTRSGTYPGEQSTSKQQADIMDGTAGGH